MPLRPLAKSSASALSATPAFQPPPDGRDYRGPKAHSLRRVLVYQMFHRQTLHPKSASCLAEQGQRRVRGHQDKPQPARPMRNSAKQVASRCWVTGVIFFTYKVRPTLHLNSQHSGCSGKSGEDASLEGGEGTQILLKKAFDPCLCHNLCVNHPH